MKTVWDYLVWYNNLDVEPFLVALGKFIEMWECDFDDVKQTDAQLQQFLDALKKTLDHKPK